MLGTLLKVCAVAVAGLLFAAPALAASPEAEAQFSSGQSALARGNAEAARSEFNKACAAGHLTACTRLGVLVQDGRGGRADAKRARDLFARACDTTMAWSPASDAEGCFFLAMMHEAGEGGPVQLERAAYLYARACDIGDGEGCTALVALMAGAEEALVPIDVSTGDMLAQLLRLGCLLNHIEACTFMYDNDVPLPSDDEIMAQQDGLVLFREAHSFPAGTPERTLYAERKAMLTEACDLGVARACARAAWEWLHGFQGMPVSEEEAATLYLRACAYGDGAGCSETGDRLRTGTDGTKDAESAAYAYEMGCLAAYPLACRSLAGMHTRGEIPADLAQARALERFVCRSGWGCATYASMLDKGTGGPVESDEARRVLKAECDERGAATNA
ncbi:MAG: tetratricopeptide repeat protein, partial [Glycocaulis sp.]